MRTEVGIEAELQALKDYEDSVPSPLLDTGELRRWSFYRAVIVEFVATLIFLFIAIATVIGSKADAASNRCSGVGTFGIAWAFGGTIFVLVYCTAGISGGHMNPAVTFGMLLDRKVTPLRAAFYVIAQCTGAICGVALVKALTGCEFTKLGGGANEVQKGFTVGTGLAVEIAGTFVLVYTAFSATDPKRNARDSIVPVLVPLPIGFAVLVVHLATIPFTGTGINPARSLAAAVVYNQPKAWKDHWIFWVGPLLGAVVAAAYHCCAVRAAVCKSLGSFRSNPSD